MKFLIGLLALASTAYGQQDDQPIVLKAQADINLNDCLCQCSTQTFVSRRRIYGNCKTADTTGANWCYIRPLRHVLAGIQGNNRRNYAFAQASSSTTCIDAKRSQRFPDKEFSYHACGTPRLDSRICQQLIYRYYSANNNNNNNGFNNNGFNNNNNGFGNNGFNNNNGGGSFGGARPPFSVGGRIGGQEDIAFEEEPELAIDSTDDGFLVGSAASSDSDAVIFK